MKCPFLTGQYMYSCEAERGVYIPSDFEMREYCESSMHSLCSFYGKAQDIWVPDVDGIEKRTWLSKKRPA